MSTITMSRQMGSQGDELAMLVAHQLGWQRVGRDLINQAAKAAGVPHVALAAIDELGLFGLRPSARDWQAYQRQVERIIRDMAEAGDVVIVGRGGQVVLHGRPDVLHVRVVAPLGLRVARLQAEKGISAEAARACLMASNQARSRFLWRTYGVRLNDPALYHLVVNTGLFSLAQAANLVIQAFQEWTHNGTGRHTSTSDSLRTSQ